MALSSNRLALRFGILGLLFVNGAACNELSGIHEGNTGEADSGAGGGPDASIDADATVGDESPPDAAPSDSTATLRDATGADAADAADDGHPDADADVADATAEGEGGCSDPQCDAGCGPSLMRCGSACVDLGVDDGNCGACGHDCQDAGCASGTCLPVTLASFQNQPSAIAVDSTNVYFTDGLGNVAGVPIVGGSPFVLASSQKPGSAIAADGTYVYWSERGTQTPDAGWVDASILRVAVDGGPPAPIATGQHYPEGIVVVGSNVYWVDNPVGSVFFAPVDGGTPVLVKSGLSYPSGLVTDGANLYCANQGDNSVERMPINPAAGAAGPLVSGLENVFSVATAAGNVFVGLLGAPDDAGLWRGAIMQVPAIGGSPARIAADVSYPLSIAADSTNVYWTEMGAVTSVGVDGGAPTRIAGGQQFPGYVAVDGTNVYWTDPMAGTVMKRVK